MYKANWISSGILTLLIASFSIVTGAIFIVSFLLRLQKDKEKLKKTKVVFMNVDQCQTLALKRLRESLPMVVPSFNRTGDEFHNGISKIGDDSRPKTDIYYLCVADSQSYDIWHYVQRCDNSDIWKKRKNLKGREIQKLLNDLADSFQMIETTTHEVINPVTGSTETKTTHKPIRHHFENPVPVKPTTTEMN